jgi:hypothetical protein
MVVALTSEDYSRHAAKEGRELPTFCSTTVARPATPLLRSRERL